MSSAELVDIQRLAYMRGTTTSKLIREFVVRELQIEDAKPKTLSRGERTASSRSGPPPRALFATQRPGVAKPKGVGSRARPSAKARPKLRLVKARRRP